MTKFGSAVLVAALAGIAIAAPSAPAVTEAPDLDKRATTCTFTGSDGAASASASQAACSTIVLADVAVPAGEAIDLRKLSDGAHTITVEGASGAVLNADGARWWDGKGGNGGTIKPKFFSAHDLTDSTFKSLYIKNTPVQAVSINGVDGLTITDMTIDDVDGDAGGGHNTDGFDIGDSSNVIITGAKVSNQDDCVAINSGNNITFSGGVCSGGHGLSIGSVGNRDNNVVDTVNFENNQVKDSTQAIRVKTFTNATGSVTGVTYSDITMSGISKYGILIEQNYDGGDLHGDPTSDLPITALTLKNISGTGAVAASGTNIAIVCGDTGCSNWT
ncbi:Endopolygalacturonase [Neonectria ditissima]|uniref:endo-polygalacturonase n=1 Tax=Neonectria ditissima TaxID=78410 RepID=A0A0P7AZJ7_9HYPO|nr:Endopolygalacturonase [Neonectria ditissima]